MKNFADSLIQTSIEKNTVLVVGLDPVVQNFPEFLLGEKKNSLEGIENAIFDFNRIIIDAVNEHVVAVKPQLAFYEVYGSHGIKALERTISYARSKGLIVINDAKRNDIGSVCEAYASAHIGEGPLSVDAVTVNPYLGSDGIIPFIEKAKANSKGIYVLLKTSNISSGEFQNLITQSQRLVYIEVGEKLKQLSKDTVGDNGYSFIGAVVGATYPEDARQLREMLPSTIFLVPGYGAQGADSQGLKEFFNKDGQGAIISSSRGIIYSYLKKFGTSGITEREVLLSIEEAAVSSKTELNNIRKVRLISKE